MRAEWSRSRAARSSSDRGRCSLLESSWGESENNRKAKFYELTKAGRRQLAAEAEEWTRVAGAMRAALEST